MRTQGKTSNKSVVELVKEATGASEEEITHTLQECGYDVNLATNKLIDGARSDACKSRSLWLVDACEIG